MGLVDIFAKVMFKRGTEAAGKKIAEAIDKRKVTKAGINQESETGWEPTAEENQSIVLRPEKCLFLTNV